jgi:hypothetical protein
MFDHAGPVALTVADAQKLDSNRIVKSIPIIITKGWVVLDFVLAYKPAPPPGFMKRLLSWFGGSQDPQTPLYLRTNVNAEDSALLSLQGQFGLKVPLDRVGTSTASLVKSAVDQIRQVSAYDSDFKKAAQTIDKIATKVKAAGGSSEPLTTVAGALSAGAGPIAAIVAGNEVALRSQPTRGPSP